VRDRFIGASPGAMPPRRPWDIVWPRVAQPLDLTLMQDAIIGVDCHWVGRKADRTRRCVLHRHDVPCDHCRRHMPIDYRGYIGAYCHAARRFVVAVIGRDAAPTVCCIVPDDRPLTGTRIILARPGSTDYGPISVRLSMQPPYKHDGPPVDILPDLIRLYGPAVLGGLDKGDFLREGE
jgi:hypothetical protein